MFCDLYALANIGCVAKFSPQIPIGLYEFKGFVEVIGDVEARREVEVIGQAPPDPRAIVHATRQTFLLSPSEKLNEDVDFGTKPTVGQWKNIHKMQRR